MENIMLENRLRAIIREEVENAIGNAGGIDPNDVYREVLNRVEELRDGAIEIPINIGGLSNGDNILRIYFIDDHTLRVEFFGREVDVPSSIEYIDSGYYVARCAVKGFYNIRLNCGLL